MRSALLPLSGTVALALLLAAPPAHTAPAGRPGPVAATRTTGPADTTVRVPLQGAVNARDLGGHRTWTGAQVAYGRVLRSDALNRLTDADLDTLAALGVTTVVDLRTPQEAAQGPDRLPPGVTALSRPVDDHSLYRTIATAIASKDPVLQQQTLGDGKAEELMTAAYEGFVTDPANRAAFAAALRDIAGAQGPLLVHCSSGKDRTGWLAYVLLRTLGVPAAEAERDYLLSNTYRADADRQARDYLRSAGYMENPDLLIPLQEVREDYLRSAVERMERDYGGLHGYLTDGLGLTPRTLVALQRRLVRHDL